MKTLKVIIEGSAEYQEELCYGTYDIPAKAIIEFDGITIEYLKKLISNTDFIKFCCIDKTEFLKFLEINDDVNFLQFSPEVIKVSEDEKIKAAGKVVSGGIEWLNQLKSDGAIEETKAKIENLCRESGLESAWDNFHSARLLSAQAKLLKLQLSIQD